MLQRRFCKVLLGAHFWRENGVAILSTPNRDLNKISIVSRSSMSTGATIGASKVNTSTVDKDEIDRFSKLADNWWDENGEFGALHTMNSLRIPLIRDALISRSSGGSPSLPLNGVKILDVGCGGGVLCEPLARLGAQVTGLDASEENIETARFHATYNESLLPRLKYMCSTVEELSAQEQEIYDSVIASEVVEHVANQSQFIKSCCDLIKPGGSLFITTINRTQLSYWLAIFAAERIFKIVPQGIHEWEKFISPEEIQQILQKENFRTVEVRGMTMNPLNLQWLWVPSTLVNFALHAMKTLPATKEKSS